MEKLRDDHMDILGDSTTVQQGLDVIRGNIEWMSLNQYEIGVWLMSSVTTSTSTKMSTTTITTTTESSASSGQTDSPSETTTESSASTEPTTDSASSASTSKATVPATQPTTTQPSSGSNIQPYYALIFIIAAMMSRL